MDNSCVLFFSVRKYSSHDGVIFNLLICYSCLQDKKMK